MKGRIYSKFNTVKIKNLPDKFEGLWVKCINLLSRARDGDLEHTKEMLCDLLNARGKVRFDRSVLLPAVMLHDVAHIDILEKYFKKVVIPEKLKDGMLIEVSTAGEIIKSLLEEMDTDPKKIEEILEIIKTQVLGRTRDIDRKIVYDTYNKKLFHDFELMARFNKRGIKIFKKTSSDKEQFRQIIANRLKLFFFDELREMAKHKFRKIEGIKESSVWGEH